MGLGLGLDKEGHLERCGLKNPVRVRVRVRVKIKVIG